MKNLRIPIWLVMALAMLVVTSSLVVGSAEPQSPVQTSGTPLGDSDVQPLMHQKLDRAKNILEGLALEDYDQIVTNAKALRLLSLESGWNVLQTAKYRSESNGFRQSADLIVEAAEAKDISRATLGYVAMTVRCVECHQYMRIKKEPLDHESPDQ